METRSWLDRRAIFRGPPPVVLKASTPKHRVQVEFGGTVLVPTTPVKKFTIGVINRWLCFPVLSRIP